MERTPSVSLHMVFVSSSESLNNPSFCKRFLIIQALASKSPKTDAVSYIFIEIFKQM